MFMTILEEILAERPKLHKGETEIKRSFALKESHLDSHSARKLANGVKACYGIGPDIAQFIYHTVNENSKTLETGAGISTLIFALKRTDHITITPNETEILSIKEYAEAKQIRVDTIRFIIDESDKYLPKCDLDGLDLILIDGKHAFPWPIVDWFYTADRLNKMGFMIIDDAQMFSVAILKAFMQEDPRWKLYRSYGNRTFVFQKLQDSVHDVAWHMQPYLDRLNKKKPFGSLSGKLRPNLSICKDLIDKIRRLMH